MAACSFELEDRGQTLGPSPLLPPLSYWSQDGRLSYIRRYGFH